jgi:uncharacterized BrkB/YihY/UPF0761 family membrane protein
MLIKSAYAFHCRIYEIIQSCDVIRKNRKLFFDIRENKKCKNILILFILILFILILLILILLILILLILILLISILLISILLILILLISILLILILLILILFILTRKIRVRIRILMISIESYRLTRKFTR